MPANPMIMPIDDWLFCDLGAFNNEAVINAINKIRQWESTMPLTEVWSDEDDLPQDLVEDFQSLSDRREVLEWCCNTKEWKSLEKVNWETLNLLPFDSIPARIAAIFLKVMAGRKWPRRTSPTISQVGVDPYTCNDQVDMVSSYARALWNEWKGRTPESVLNVTACPKEIVGASILIAALDWVPVYLWSERLSDLLWLPGWELPDLKDDEDLLKDLLNGVPPQSINKQGFLSRWLPVVHREKSTASAIILRERFKWKEDTTFKDDSEFS